MKKWLFILLLVDVAFLATGQVTFSVGTSAKTDSVKPIPRRSKIRSYQSVVTRDASTHNGLFTVHEVRDSIFLEIPDSILHRDIECISRLSKGPGGIGMYAGEELDEKTIYFQKNPDSTVSICYDLVISEADSGSAISRAVKASNLDPAVFVFPIIAYNREHTSMIVDATVFMKSASFINSLGKTPLAKASNGAMKDFRIDFIHAYPNNVEISISKNILLNAVAGNPAEPGSMVSHTSFIALPEIPMQRRMYDPRVGYFADYVHEFNDKQQKAETRYFIDRWRLEPREEDRAKWERGEMVEPKKPIVFYIDPATPRQWRKYLIEGVDDWQKAFEKAGFKNAIVGREWPDNDSVSLDDARYSFICYLPSETANAYGPNVHDPRSGEIIQSHIGWYHNVMSLVHSWYMIQAGAADPQARKPEFDEELMGQLIRFVSSHEVGHTLGLRHNFGSSSQTPVDSLRSRTWLEAHGHTASIMDYARFDYVAQPEDRIPEQDLFPHIGEYDRWAIQWGYQYANAATEEDYKKGLERVVTDSLAKNPRLWFGDGEKDRTDPRCQTEDLGDNIVKADTYGIRNLKRILPNLPAWTHEEGGMYENLQVAYKALQDQYFRYMAHVLKFIGGVEHTIRSEDAQGEVYSPVPKDLQRQALGFFNDQLFTTPRWLLEPTVVNKTGKMTDPNFVEDVQIRVLNSLLDTSMFKRLIASSNQFGIEHSYPIEEYLSTLHRSIWKELVSGAPMDSYRRNLQKSYVGALTDILLSTRPDETETDIYTLVKVEINHLLRDIKTALPKFPEGMDKYHLEDLASRIKKTLESKAS